MSGELIERGSGGGGAAGSGDRQSGRRISAISEQLQPSGTASKTSFPGFEYLRLSGPARLMDSPGA